MGGQPEKFRVCPPTLGRGLAGLYRVHSPLGLIGDTTPWTERQSVRKMLTIVALLLNFSSTHCQTRGHGTGYITKFKEGLRD
jgi:hypothetical protein